MQGAEEDDETRNLVGAIAEARATLALTRYQVEPLLVQSRRALAYLHAANQSKRATAHWTLGVAHMFQGDRAAARRAYTEAVALSQAAGDIFTIILATIGLGNVQEADNQLYLAAETYRRVLQMGVISRCRLSTKRILAWPVSSTNGTTWMPPSSTGDRVSTWRDSMRA